MTVRSPRSFRRVHRPFRRFLHGPALGGLAATLGSAMLLGSPAVGAALSGAVGPSGPEVGSVLRDQLEDSGIPGAAVAVVAGDQVTVESAGTRGGSDAVSPATPFVIGSASKSVTALAVMQLVDAGTVDLDAPVRTYVPDLQLAAGEPVGQITVRHLLQHTSGLDDLEGGPLLASARDGTPAAAVAELSEARLASVPGTSWLYANANYVLAGMVVEQASGMPYGQYVEQRIFAPLGMTHSHVASAPAEADGLSRGHRFWFGIPIEQRPTLRHATLAAGYLVSTAEDLGRYLTVFLDQGVGPDGNRVASAAAIRTLTTAGPEAHLGPWADGQRSRYAMGWFVGGPWDDSAVFHPGNTPDSTALLAVLPDQDTAVAVVLNAGNELPVPGNPYIADRVARNVVHAAVGQDVAPLPSLTRFYLFFDLVGLALVAAAALLLWSAARRPRRGTGVRRRPLAWTGALLAAAVTVVLVYLPMASYGWRGVWTWAPDLAVLLATLAVLTGLAAALRTAALLRGSRRSDPTSTDSEGSHLHVHA